MIKVINSMQLLVIAPKMYESDAQAESTSPQESNSVVYKISPVEKKPSRKYRKGSKYDGIIDSFRKGKDILVAVTVEGKDANYLRTQLNKRIEARNIKKIKVSVVNNVCYLEK